MNISNSGNGNNSISLRASYHKLFAGHKSTIVSMIKIHSNVLVSGGADNCLKFWNITTGKCVHTIVDAHSNWVHSLAYQSSQNVLISASTGESKIHYWKIKGFDDYSITHTVKLATNVHPLNESIAYIKLVQEESVLLCGSSHGSIVMYDMNIHGVMPPAILPKVHYCNVWAVAICE